MEFSELDTFLKVLNVNDKRWDNDTNNQDCPFIKVYILIIYLSILICILMYTCISLDEFAKLKKFMH